MNEPLPYGGRAPHASCNCDASFVLSDDDLSKERGNPQRKQRLLFAYMSPCNYEREPQFSGQNHYFAKER